jgi:hypothetical protein
MFGKYRNSKKDSSYLTGLEVGKKIAITELRDIHQYECINLTQEEKQNVIEFLIKNNLEFGYDVENGGFYVLKKLSKSE